MQMPHDARIKYLLPGSDEVSAQQTLFLSISLSKLRPWDRDDVLGSVNHDTQRCA